MSEPTMEQTAYHEAAHAVLAHLSGIYTMEGIDCTGSERAEAAVHRHGDLCEARLILNQGKPIDHDLELAIIYGAGCEAERKYLQDRGLPVDDDALFRSGHGDVLAVRDLLGQQRWFGVAPRSAFYLNQPQIWAVVESVAAAVITRNGVLTGDQVSWLLEAACTEFDLPEWQVLT
jgi:hypothetical protein